jgi:hypothetical protein
MSAASGDNAEKYDTARKAIHDNKIQSMRFACWVTKATGTHSAYKLLSLTATVVHEGATVFSYMYVSFFK